MDRNTTKLETLQRSHNNPGCRHRLFNWIFFSVLQRRKNISFLYPSLRTTQGPFFGFFQVALYSSSTFEKFTITGKTKPSDHPFGFDTEKNIHDIWATCLWYRSRKILDSDSRERGLMTHLGNLPSSVSMELRASFLPVPQF